VTMCDGRDDVFGSGCGIKNTVTIDTDRHRERGKVKGAYLRVEISSRKYNPNPLSFSHGKHSRSGGKRDCFPLLPNGECRGFSCLQNESIGTIGMLSKCKHGSAHGSADDSAGCREPLAKGAPCRGAIRR